MIYEATANEDIIKEVTDVEIDLSLIISEYQRLKVQYLNQPQLKTVPDEETLAFYNNDVEVNINFLKSNIEALYYRVKPIYEAGFLPDKYHDEYAQLENLVIG